MLALGVYGAAPAHAEGPAESPPVRGALGVGGYLAITGPATLGGVVDASIYPGGPLGRLGFRLEARTFETEVGEGFATAGLLYEAGSSRPRITIAFHGDGGVSFDGEPVLGGGVITTLWIVGPLALGFDGAGHFLYDSIDSVFVISGATTLRLAF